MGTSLPVRVAKCAVIAWAALVPALAGAAVQLSLVGDRLTLSAEAVPLQEVLREFSRYGVQVRVDPRINPAVSAQIRNMELDRALERILDRYDYAITWDVVPMPVGSVPRLSQIQVFVRGEPQRMRPLAPAGTNLVVTRGPVPGSPEFVQDEILLVFRRGADAASCRRLLAEIGGTVVDRIPVLGIYRIRLRPGTNVQDLVAQLARNGIVSKAEPNYVYRNVVPVRGEGIAPAGGVRIAAPSAGAKVPAVAILDTGLAPNLGLDSLLLASLDATAPENTLSDTAGHGTQMALIATGAVTPGGASSAAGAAGVPIIPIRTFDDNGNGSAFGLMRAATFAVDNGARVVSMSWGSPTQSEFVDQTMAHIVSHGAIPVAAAGNEPTGKPVYPAASLGVLAVAAAMPDGSAWTSSNYGSFVDLAAPGTAAMPVGYKGPPGSYAGTSIATAYVAGTLARYFALHPDATPAEAEAALFAALSDAGDKGADSRYGAGLLTPSAVATFLAP